MTANRYRAGQPAELNIDFAGDEPEDVETVDQWGRDALAIVGIVAFWALIAISAFISLIAAFVGYWSMK